MKEPHSIFQTQILISTLHVARCEKIATSVSHMHACEFILVIKLALSILKCLACNTYFAYNSGQHGELHPLQGSGSQAILCSSGWVCMPYYSQNHRSMEYAAFLGKPMQESKIQKCFTYLKFCENYIIPKIDLVIENVSMISVSCLRK